MLIRTLELIEFKNYSQASLQFNPGINCLVGPNGTGKTNLLDALFYLCMTKSAFNAIDSQNIRHGSEFFSLKGLFERKSLSLRVKCSLQKGERKQFTVEKKAYNKISEHIGLLPCVLLTPDDTDLVREGSETRRKHFDSTLSQIDSLYLANLIRYQQVLKQRNALLKQTATERRPLNTNLLDTYDAMIVPLGQQIFESRKAFIAQFLPHFAHFYQALSNSCEQVQLTYSSEMAQPGFAAQFRQNRSKDLTAQRTTMGIHRDDFVFTIGRHPLKKFGSQGQQKTFVIALKFAKFAAIQAATGLKPLLLLDDIFDKLDDMRIGSLLALMADSNFGQVFITDARPERSAQLLQGYQPAATFFDVPKLSSEL